MFIGTQIIERRRPAVRVTSPRKDTMRALVAISIVLTFVAVETIGGIVSPGRHFGDHYFGDVTMTAVHFVGTGNVLMALAAVAIVTLIKRFPLTDDACVALSREDR